MLLLPVLCALAVRYGCLGADEGRDTNLVRNPSFEETTPEGEPVTWSNYVTVAGVAHTGERSLFYENLDRERYVLCTQPIELVPGKAYEVTAWIKTENVEGPESGATVCLEWYSADGEYLGGYYPPGFKGTGDWRRLSGVSARVAEGAARCSVVCYMRRGITGRAWWDDIEVRQWRQPPLDTLLLKPNYRGEVLPGVKEVELLARVDLRDWDLDLRDVALRAEIRRRDNGATVQSTVRRLQEAETTIKLSTRRIPPGKYHLRVGLQRQSDGAELEAETWRLNVLELNALADRKAYIDRHNRLIVDGKPFFPLGMYWGSITEEDLRLYADSPFNCLMPYGEPTKEQMDLALQYGLRVIYTIKDVYYGSAYCPPGVKTLEDERAYIQGKAEAFRDHPALLAWYLNDELPQEYMERLEAHQDWMEELDPNHPTWVVLYQVNEVRQYVRTFDVIGTDPYPIPGDKARRAGLWTRLTVDAVRAARPVWMVPQVFNWACYRKTEEEKQGLRPPTLEEMRSMTWQCIAEGAHGLVYYSWFDIKRDTVVPFEQQWSYVKQVASEVKELVPVLLSVEPTPRFTAPTEPWLHWTVRKLGKRVYLIAVNDEDRPHLAVFRLGRAPARIRIHNETAALSPTSNGLLEVSLEPFGVRIYEIEF